tara:strand:+ start:1057 stop:1359 length:303 start_codon:yes stop_codon:yes gene_type:complete
MTVKCDYMGAIIGWKHNHQAGMITRDGEITEFPGGIPSDSDINTWKAEYDAHVTATAYKDKREAEYPSYADQFDLIYHSGIDAWKAKIKETKDKYPKGDG